MKRVESYEAYKALVTKARESGFSLSNCFFLPEAIREKIRYGMIIAMQIPNGLLILEDREDFYRCYYYLSGEAPLEPVVLDKPAVIEFPYNGKMTPKQSAQVEKILAMGFTLGRESAQMILEDFPPEKQSLSEMPFELCFAQEADLDASLKLLNATFDRLYAFIPSKEELRALLQEHRIWLVKDNGIVVALLHASRQKDYATIEQLAVSPQYRGRGLAKYLLQNYHEYYRNHVRGFYHWVDIRNLQATTLYTMFGYRFGMKKANEYIQREEKKL